MTEKEIRKWKQRMPEEYRDCTKEEYDRLVEQLKEEWRGLADNPSDSLDDILEYLDRNEKLLEMIAVTDAYNNQLMMEEMIKKHRKRKKN
ncbi:MAG: hypothetical protein IJ471_05655 [Eubacterium sp.]|nr:hypothetical protein [Eubacterium sp.]